MNFNSSIHAEIEKYHNENIHHNQLYSKVPLFSYPYLSLKVAVVAGKLDPTVDQTCFRRIFQTVRNLQKRTTGMSLEGPKMGEGGMGRSGMAEKRRKPATQGGGHCRIRRPDAGASGGGWP